MRDKEIDQMLLSPLFFPKSPLLIVCMAFDIIRHVHSSRNDGSSFRVLVPSVTQTLSYAESK